MIKKKDWRENIKDHDTLYDLDPAEVMVFLRHQYLVCAKDLCKDNDDWFNMGEKASIVAELLDDAIAIQHTQKNYINLEPA